MTSTLNSLWSQYEALTRRCEGLAAEIRKGDPDTASLAIRQFGEANEERIGLMRTLGLVPYGAEG